MNVRERRTCSREHCRANAIWNKLVVVLHVRNNRVNGLHSLIQYTTNTAPQRVSLSVSFFVLLRARIGNARHVYFGSGRFSIRVRSLEYLVVLIYMYAYLYGETNDTRFLE